MSKDRYVIVYQDGSCGEVADKERSDQILHAMFWGIKSPNTYNGVQRMPKDAFIPAYRIRCREKSLRQCMDETIDREARAYDIDRNRVPLRGEFAGYIVPAPLSWSQTAPKNVQSYNTQPARDGHSGRNC